MKKGMVYEGKDKSWEAAYHKVIYLEGDIDGDFTAGIITHSTKHGNISMSSDHFESKDKNGIDHAVTYDKSFLMPNRIIKMKAWGPYSPVGMLTEEGISFVEESIGKTNPLPWDMYQKLKALV